MYGIRNSRASGQVWCKGSEGDKAFMQEGVAMRKFACALVGTFLALNTATNV